MPRIQIPPPSSGGLMLSYKCQARCRHCIYACSPEWKADFITEEQLDHGLAQLRQTIQPSMWGRDQIGLSDGLHFTGGEPFINFDLLLRAIELGTKHTIPSMFVETNSGWAIDDDTTRDKLQCLRDAGLHGIMISVNPFYAEYVPFAITERCIRISQEVFGIRNVIIYQMEYYLQFKRLGIRDTLSLDDYQRLAARDTAFVDRVEMFFMGRAITQLKDSFPTHPAHAFFHMPCQPPFLRDWHNHFDNYGNYMPGFCGGLSLGNWFELDRLLEEGIELDDFSILHHLIRGDMRGLFEFAQGFGYQANTRGYLSKCDLCTDIRRFLLSKQDFAELRPVEFYAHLA
jgi:hypothetical protein